jgi:hypothetical protein
MKSRMSDWLKFELELSNLSFLKKHKIGLDANNVPFLPGKVKTVFLLQVGLKNFQYIHLNIDATGVKTTIGEEDLNWAINSYERSKKLFNQSKLMELLPYAALAFTGIIILLIFYYFFKEFHTLADVATAMKEAAQAMAAAKTGTAVIPA